MRASAELSDLCFCIDAHLVSLHISENSNQLLASCCNLPLPPKQKKKLGVKQKANSEAGSVLISQACEIYIQRCETVTVKNCSTVVLNKNIIYLLLPLVLGTDYSL